MAKSSKKVTRKARKNGNGTAATMSASTLAIASGKAISEEMEAAAKRAKAALRKPTTVPQLAKAAKVGLHSARALVARLHAKPVEGQRGAYRL